MARIKLYTDPFDLSQAEVDHHDGPLIDWLQVCVPTGFGGPHVTVVNGRRLDVADYDLELQPNDDVAIVAMPAIPGLGAIIVQAIITAAVSMAVSYIVNAIFGPGDVKVDPTKASTPSPSAVYSISAPTNQARFGAPIPVIHGTVLATPDLAAQPYVYYRDNDQYLDVLLCLGHGEFAVYDLQVADTPVSQMKGGVLEYRVYGPSRHNQTFGFIQNDFTRFKENVDTSPEVSDQELLPVEKIRFSGEVTTSNTITVLEDTSKLTVGDTFELKISGYDPQTVTISAIAGQVITVTPGGLPTTSQDYHFTVNKQATATFTDNSAAVPAAPDTYLFSWEDDYTSPAVPGDTVEVTVGDFTSSFTVTGTVTSFGAVDGRYIQIEVITATGGPPGSPAVMALTIRRTAASSSKPSILFSINDAAAIIGPYSAFSPGHVGTEVWFDLVFPAGLYETNERDGSLRSTSVDVQFDLEQIDDDGTPTGLTEMRTETITKNHNTPQRFTFKYDGLAQGRWRASAMRLSPISDRAMDQSRCIWSGLKGIIDPPGRPVYGDTTLIAVRIKATNGLATDAAQRIGVQCSRSGIATAEDAYLDVVTNAVYGASRPLTEVETSSVARLSKPFNAVWDFKTTAWEAIQQCAQVAHGSAITDGGQVAVVIDEAKTVARWAFTEKNIVAGSVEAMYRFDYVDEIDGYEVEYRDPRTFLASVIVYPAGAVNAEKVTLFGSTSQADATAFGKYLWQRRKYRRKWLSWVTELDGHLPTIGDMVSVEHPLLNGKENYVISIIQPQDRWTVRLEGYRYDERVFT